MSSPATLAFLADLRQQLPPAAVLSRPVELAPYVSDALTAFQAQPLAVVLPTTSEEVVTAVRLCARHQIPFVARGSGTSLSGGSLPIEGGLVIGLNRLNRLLHLDPERRIAVVQPGFINLQVSVAASPHGLYYAPDPSSQPVSTIGGNLAFNSGGAHCLKYGMTSNHVLGARVVLPTGEVVELGGESLESVGPDWLGLFVGSEGLMGIALEITLRLLPRVETYHTVLAAYSSLEDAGHAVSAVIASGLLPGAMEIMDSLAIEAAEAAVKAGYPLDARALLIVELEGEALAVAAEAQALEKVIADSGAVEVRVAASSEERMKIWKGRKAAFSAVGRLSPDYIVQDGVVPRSRLGEALVHIEGLSRQYGLRVANVFHAGDGNLHPLVLFNGKEPGQLERAEELAGQILAMCVSLGGSITGEHGVGVEKRAYMPQMFADNHLQAMQAMRLAVDPHQLSNRGKVFPQADGEKAPGPRVGSHPLEQLGLVSRE